MSVADEKLQVVRSILTNPTYMPDSGLYQRLEAALMRLSLDVLKDLDLLLSLKKGD
jgi:hypothetical protein